MSIVGNLAQGWLGSSAEKKAARQRAQGIEEAGGYQTRGYEESKGYYQPYYQAGQEGLNALRGMMEFKPFSMADYQQDPGYQFRLKEGLKELQRGAAARGGAFSGNTLLGMQERAQNLASQEYGNAYGRYMQNRQEQLRVPTYLTGMGQQVAGSMSDIANQYAANMANLRAGLGNVRAQGTIGSANAWSQAIGRSEQEMQNMAKNILGMK